MKRYEFRMAKVLRVRRLQEDAAKAAVAAARRAEDAATAAVASSLQRYAALPATAHGTQSAAAFLGLRDRADWRGEAVRHAEVRRDHAADATGTAVGAWQVANRRVAALDRLDDRRREEYAVLAQRDADAAVDEIVTARARRSA